MVAKTSFDNGQYEFLHWWTADISCYHYVFHIHYTTEIPSAFEHMSDYTKMLCAVIMNEVFKDVAD